MMAGRALAVLGAAAMLSAVACGDAGTSEPTMVEEPVANMAAAEPTPEPLGPEPMKEGDPDQILGAETVEAVFDGYDAGDLVRAEFSNPIRPGIAALVDARVEGLADFLTAHEGHPMTVRLETVRTFVEQAGGAVEAKKVVGAQTEETTAEVWWQTLDEEERKAARKATERLMAPAG